MLPSSPSAPRWAWGEEARVPTAATSVPEDDRLLLKVMWHDSTSALDREFVLTVFPKDNNVEMYDVKNKRVFLSRIRCDTVSIKDLVVGNTVYILSRNLVVTEYCNDWTRRQLEAGSEVTLALIKPDGVKELGKILTSIEDAGFSIGRAKMVKLSSEQVEKLFSQDREDDEDFSDLVSFMTSGPVAAVELLAKDCIGRFQTLLGPADPEEARAHNSNTLRARFGKSGIQNAIHGSQSIEQAKKEIEFFFPSSLSSPREREFSPKAVVDQMESSTLCVIKPHALSSGMTGRIVSEIQSQGFRLNGMISSRLKYENAEEFFEIYKGVVQDYTGMVRQLSSGRCLALCLGTKEDRSVEEVVQALRDVCGPSNSSLAASVRPNSLRAKFSGKNPDENGVHCTDLPEDAILELEYFFKIIKDR